MNNDLISREALKESLEELKKSPWYLRHRKTIDGIACRQAQKEALQVVENIIDNAPTVEPPVWQYEFFKKLYEKVKTKGKWIDDNGDDRCSNCRSLRDSIHGNFCPNCGADMRGEKNGDDERNKND